jgi:hypothetical protein
MVRVLGVVLVLGLALVGCGGQPSTCEEVADQTVELMQRIIDDIEQEAGDMSVTDFLDSAESLPESETFAEESQKLNKRGTELGCDQTDLDALIAARIGSLHAETPVGQFIMDQIQSVDT